MTWTFTCPYCGEEMPEAEVNGHLQECDDDNPFYPFA